jgi:hypothetical protein
VTCILHDSDTFAFHTCLLPPFNHSFSTISVHSRKGGLSDRISRLLGRLERPSGSDISGEHWDGLEICIPVIRVRAILLHFLGSFTDLGAKSRPSTPSLYHFLPSSRRIQHLKSPHFCVTSTCPTQHTAVPSHGHISWTACQSQIRPSATRSSFTTLWCCYSTLTGTTYQITTLVCLSTRRP